MMGVFLLARVLLRRVVKLVGALEVLLPIHVMLTLKLIVLGRVLPNVVGVAIFVACALSGNWVLLLLVIIHVVTMLEWVGHQAPHPPFGIVVFINLRSDSGTNLRYPTAVITAIIEVPVTDGVVVAWGRVEAVIESITPRVAVVGKVRVVVVG